MQCRHTFVKVLSLVPRYSECTSALTFENFCPGPPDVMSALSIEEMTEPYSGQLTVMQVCGRVKRDPERPAKE